MLKHRSAMVVAAVLSLSFSGEFSIAANQVDSPVAVATLGRFFAESRWDEALETIDKELKQQPNPENDFFVLARGLVLAEKKEWTAVRQTILPLAHKTGLWSDYVNHLLAQAQYQLGNLKESREAAERLKKGETSRKIFNDSQILLGEIALKDGRFAEARNIFVGLEKRVRREAEYGPVLWNLALSERGLNKNHDFCRRMIKIYRDYPDLDRAKEWGPFLDENKVNNKESLCSFGWDDLLDRNRNLMLSGQMPRAKAEITEVEKRAQGQKSFEVDRLKAQFALQEGEVSHALELLVPYYSQRKSDLNYLMVLASAAARAGDSNTAIGAYLLIHRQAGGTSRAKQALYQAAFMSYQYQDYDGATRRFRQFLKENANSGLALDAEWHLAWISYLKGNYGHSYQQLAELKDKINSKKYRARNQSVDRVEYWMAMSQLRLKNYGLSRNLFQEVAHIPGESYYSMAARQRLKQVEQIRLSTAPANLTAVGSERKGRWIASESIPTNIHTLRRAKLLAFDSTEVAADSQPAVNETEDTLALNPLSGQSPDEENEEAGEGTDQKIVDVGEPMEILSTSTNATIVQRFDRARRLISLGLGDLAKWELYEIERKTANKDYLRQLIAEYENIEQFHRSSGIASNRFVQARLEGFEAQRGLWQSAYPKAYEKEVNDSSQKFTLPKEMVWAIMRAESSFKRDALSPVGALGLMQVMPKTGEKISQILGINGFEPNALLKPAVAIQLGSKYLQRLSKDFDANRALMAAAYNAGPHRVKTWLTRFGTLELDEFIEHIPFLETRNYVKKVVTNYQVYSRLYSNQADVFPELAQTITVRVLDPVPTKETWEDI